MLVLGRCVWWRQGSASECVLISMLVARHAALNELKLNSPNVEEGILLSRLVAYCSKLVQIKFHGIDTDTDNDTDFLADFRARILARKSERKSVSVSMSVSVPWNLSLSTHACLTFSYRHLAASCCLSAVVYYCSSVFSFPTSSLFISLKPAC